MSEHLTISCPHCSFSRSVPRQAIPPGARQANCPHCGQSFPLDDQIGARHRETDSSGTLPPQTPPPTVQTPQPPREPPSGSPRTLGFAFEGSANDYFGIWIVNTLLRILTLGIYSAWAKVRRRRFFYGSTTLQGEQFDYLADPMVLFRGWVVAAIAFVLYSVGAQVSVPLSSAIGLIIFIAFPWLLVRSRIFNALNSSHRSIRFGFRPAYRQAYLVYAGLPILTGLSLGLLAPYMIYRQKKFTIENSSFGSVPFSFTARAKDFYLLAFKLILGIIVAGMLIAMAAGLAGAGTPSAVSAHTKVEAVRRLILFSTLMLAPTYFILMIYGQTALTNLCWNATALGADRFRSTLRTRDMALLFVTNAVAISFSLGLLVPWARVRLARYRFRHLELQAEQGLERVIAAAGSGAAVGAFGEEIGDIFDMNIDIAL